MKSKDVLAPVYESSDQTSVITARLQAGVVAQVKHCAVGWCHVAGNGFDGWIEQQRLWGGYADEKLEWAGLFPSSRTLNSRYGPARPGHPSLWRPRKRDMEAGAWPGPDHSQGVTRL